MLVLPPEPTRDAVNAAIVAFCQRLRSLENRAPRDAPTIRDLVDDGRIARSTAYHALTGRHLPSAETVRVLVTAWGGDVSWWLRHRKLIAQAQRALPGVPRPAPGESRYQHPVDDTNYQALLDLARHMSQYLQHLPVCGLGDPVPDPATPGVVISTPVEGCTCGLAKAMPLWHSTVWGEEPFWLDEDDRPATL